MLATDFPFTTNEKARFRDIDAFGHVNNAVYLTYLETARFDFFMQVFEPEAPNQLPVILGEVTCRYLAPGQFQDSLVVGMGVEAFGRKSFTIRAQVDTVEGRQLAISKATVVMYDYSAETTFLIPDWVKIKVNDLQNGWVAPEWGT